MPEAGHDACPLALIRFRFTFRHGPHATDEPAMNRRTARFRILTLLLASAFLASLSGRAAGSHHCPHHDLPPAASVAESHATHDGHAAPAQSSVPTAPDHDSHGPCSCIGQCSTSAGPLLSATPFAAPAFHGNTTDARAVVAANETVPARPHFLLPFAHGPPAQFAA
jgi:hypothetical protein